MAAVYDEEYFAWQKEIGEFGGKANLFKFEGYFDNTDDILDFGCGGGYLLENIITSGRKIGIEINPAARREAERKGIECYPDFTKIEDSSMDVIISNHALEHVQEPWNVMKEFKRVLRNGGIIVIVVPHETSRQVKKDDRSKHLYTWSPQNLVNLFMVCGIEEVEYKSICHMWPPHFKTLQKLLGWKVFHRLSWLWCKIKGTGYQTCVSGVVRKGDIYESGIKKCEN